jgi:MFS family permease
MEKSINSESNMQKVALTSLAGTSIEWYDFFLYGASAALIFPTVFFGEASTSTALILSLLTFAAGFIARPIGGIIFGHFGDKVGRKKTLIMALILMGVSSTLIGLLPTYAMIGVTCTNSINFFALCSRPSNRWSVGRGNATCNRKRSF